MFWVILFAAIAAAGLLMLVGYAIWLAHKASDVFAELKVLGERSGRIAETLSRIEIPAGLGGSDMPAAVPAAEREATASTDDTDQNATQGGSRGELRDVR